jgi:enoyl-CoA hydratase/carnithine racemase
MLLEIDNPPRNTLGRAMREQMRGHLHAADADFTVRAVVVSGRGKAFCSGDDLREELEALGERGSRGGNLLDFASLLEQVEQLRVPVVAAIGGWCVGGGVELALCCDVRIASTQARFVCAGVNVGLMASAYRLPRLIGLGPARHLLLTGSPADVAWARACGLVTAVHADDELAGEALVIAARIASRAPLSVEASKRVSGLALDLDPEKGREAQGRELATLLQSSDHVEAVRAFLEKRDPKFTRS